MAAALSMDGLDGVSAFEDASVQNAVRDLAAAEAFFDDDAAAFDDDAAPLVVDPRSVATSFASAPEPVGASRVPLAALRSGTLDEPVAETLLRDAREVCAKLRLVVAPRASQADTLERLKEWDLWGPLAVCLLLGVALSASAPEAQGGLAFAAAFVVVWLGAAAVTLNAQLLGGALSFFQAVCVLGYSVFPLALAALAGLPLRAATASRPARAAVVLPCFAWSTRVSVVFFGEVIGPAKRALATYPVFLFYAFLSFMILIN
jgi:hypothetical protein